MTTQERQQLIERLRGRKVSVSANDLRQAADLIERYVPVHDTPEDQS